MSELNLTSENFDQETASGVVMVDFGAEWCGPCKMAGPVIDQLEKDYAGKIKVGKLDVDENPQISQKYAVMSIPTVIIF